ncbi:transcription factor TFIIIC subunit tfc4 [Coelomomyces lativittatus]|nr:transcription factor TFIIIC subunit tfc4 [Coelomomyces lativittatus]
MLHLHLIGIALGVKARNFLKVSQFCRWLITHYPYRCDIYRIYCAVLCSGHDASNIFTSTPQQKFLRRILVHRFRGTLRKHMTPQEVEKYGKQRLIPVKDVSERIWAAKPILLMTYGHSMSYSGSVCDAINYYIKAYALVPHDPLINLQLGLMHLYRSMQRMTENRHLHVAHAFTFLFQYAELARPTSPLSLIHYNLGRAFHQLNLVTYAVKYYQSSLEANDCPTILREAAYNLCLIYMQVQSYHLSKLTMQKYLTI